ncbi:MAG: GAF domain-containing protein [Bryobacteraceae bacterium]|nr:GAF domain-containing protein [Bryobacteraceae bacterium]
MSLMKDLDQALTNIVAQVGADSGTIHLLGEDGVLHLRAATRNIPPPVLEAVKLVPVGKGMAGLAVERNAPVDACNIQSDQSGDVRPGAKATGLQGAIVVPMVGDGRAVGALGVANFRERTFTAEEIAMLLAAGAGLVAE